MKTQVKVLDGKFSIEMLTCGSGEPLLYLHNSFGHLPAEPFLDELGKDFKVYAPHFPGYGDSTGGEHIYDVFDAALFYHQLMDELGLASANILGHAMGGMLAAEIAALDPHRAKKLVLAAPQGFWIDSAPQPDLFAAMPADLARMLFFDTEFPMAKMMSTLPPDNNVLQTIYVERAKRFAMAGKLLWPLPDRGLKKRAYRISAPTLLIWGEGDRMVPPVYAKEFTSRIKNAKVEIIKQAGHMLMYEQQEAFVGAVKKFLKS
ncbi:MAG: alpha/beta fold hydrolase [Candidatus Binataceae bacterium]